MAMLPPYAPYARWTLATHSRLREFDHQGQSYTCHPAPLNHIVDVTWRKSMRSNVTSIPSDMPWFFTTWVDQTWNSINLRAAAAHFGIVFLVVVVASGNNSLAIPLPQLCHYVDLPGSYQIYRQIPGSCSRSKDSKKGVKKVRMQEIKNKKHHHHHPAKEQQQGFAALQGSTYYVIVQSEGTLLPKQRCSFLQSYTQFISVKCWGSSRMM